MPECTYGLVWYGNGFLIVSLLTFGLPISGTRWPFLTASRWATGKAVYGCVIV